MFNLSCVRTLRASLLSSSSGLTGGMLALAESVTKLILNELWCDEGLLLHLRKLRDIYIKCPNIWTHQFWYPRTPASLARCLRERHDPRNADILQVVTRVVVESGEESQKLSDVDIDSLMSIPGLEFRGISLFQTV